jgi:hypothetical protein
MKLIVETLKRGKFEVEADGGQTIAQLKGAIESATEELTARAKS